jgi:hypothetical protein
LSTAAFDLRLPGSTFDLEFDLVVVAIGYLLVTAE